MFRYIKTRIEEEHKFPVLLILCISTLFNFTILYFRIFYTKDNMFIFLIWNLFLGWIPLAISSFLLIFKYRLKSKILIFCLIALWLLFFPNAPYIITDLFHLGHGSMPDWFDLLLLISFAWTGLVYGLVSLIDIFQYLCEKTNKFISWLFILISIALGSFGIYIGRFLRWNSWDIITEPKALFTDIFEQILDPFNQPGTIGMTIMFFFFILFGFLTLKYINRGFKKKQVLN